MAPLLDVSHPPPNVHPLTPLVPHEIITSGTILKAAVPLEDKSAFEFKTITLLEPPKAELQAWDEGSGSGPRPVRQSYTVYSVRDTPYMYEAVVDLEAERLVSNTRVKEAYHVFADGPEIINVEKVALADERVRKEIEQLQLPEGSRVVADPWIYGSDGRTEPEYSDLRRQFQCYLYLADAGGAKGDDFNHYAFPLPISPVVDVQTMKVVRIDYLPTGADFTGSKPTKYVPAKIANEYTPEHQNMRKNLKPLHVVQPEGASFTVTEEVKDSGGAVVEWQKWRIRTVFNQREGLVLYNVTYDGRPLFYRVSLSDMNIPYADPRAPYHRKSAFDLGDAGAGTMANDLKLGCDCLGSIYYLSSYLCDITGAPEARPNAVCIHEQDAGIGFKHMNYRTGRAVVTRSRELVLQTIITVSNYEYIMAYIFNQAGEMTYEVRATGILSTAPIAHGVEVPWGTVVHPGVLAQYHQHIFSLRLDPSVDGANNKVVYEEAHPLPLGPSNPYGVGYITHETEISRSGGFNTNPEANRVFKIQNREKRNPINGKNVGYKIMVPPYQKMLAHPTSLHYKRAEFADQAVYVTRFRDGEYYAAGKWTNQSRGGDGVRTYAARDEEIGGDPVVWVQFGINHIPRIEDFPVMPCETLRVMFKPVGFFDRNPALDVPESTQQFNRSVLLSTDHRQAAPGVEAVVNGNGSVTSAGSCCINGNGLANGHANGHVNGLTNGLTNGHANGLTNGNGHA